MYWASCHERCVPKSLGILLPVLLALCVATRMWSQEQQNAENASTQQPSAFLPAQENVASSEAATLVLKEATPVKLKLLHSLNSKTTVKDDPLNFALAEDLVVDDKVIARAGAVAIGYVREAKHARTLGRGAHLALEMQYLKVGRMRVPLRGSEARVGADKKGETVTLVVLFGLSGLVKHGAEIEVKEGAVFTAYVDRDMELPVVPDVESKVP